MHILEHLEIAGLKHLKLIFFLPESGRIVAIPELSERLFSHERPLLVNTRPVDEVVEISLIGRAH